MKTNKITSASQKSEGGGSRQKIRLPFSSINFYMMGGCLLLIIVGFALMSGGGSSADTSFNPEIFSARRIVVGPALTFFGFLLMAFAIIWSPDKTPLLKKMKKNPKENDQQ